MSYSYLKYHVVFSTKERRPWIAPTLLPRLCEYMGGIVCNLEGHPVEFNGPEDHLHLVLSIPATKAIADFMRELKSCTTDWVRETFPDLKSFCWQDGYSVFTVSPSALPKVVAYVRNQQEHHRKVSFRDEIVWLFKNHGIEFDEKYI